MKEEKKNMIILNDAEKAWQKSKTLSW
jgi:hypothetical protein